jgi:hypothetical protein
MPIVQIMKKLCYEVCLVQAIVCACSAACLEALGCPNSSQAPHWAQWPVHSIIHFHIIADIPKAADKARKRFVSGIHSVAQSAETLT